MRPLSRWLSILSLSVLIISLNQLVIDASSVQSAKTNASIGFYGEYEYDGPDPEPPVGPQEPELLVDGDKPSLENDSKSEDGDLPQANQLSYQSLYPWLGLFLILIAYQQIHEQRQRRLASKENN